MFLRHVGLTGVSASHWPLAVSGAGSRRSRIHALFDGDLSVRHGHTRSWGGSVSEPLVTTQGRRPRPATTELNELQLQLHWDGVKHIAAARLWSFQAGPMCEFGSKF